MSKPTKQQRVQKKAERILSQVMGRREFTAALAAVGITGATASEIAAAQVDAEAALALTYQVFANVVAIRKKEIDEDAGTWLKDSVRGNFNRLYAMYWERDKAYVLSWAAVMGHEVGSIFSNRIRRNHVEDALNDIRKKSAEHLRRLNNVRQGAGVVEILQEWCRPE